MAQEAAHQAEVDQKALETEREWAKVLAAWKNFFWPPRTVWGFAVPTDALAYDYAPKGYKPTKPEDWFVSWMQNPFTSRQVREDIINHTNYIEYRDDTVKHPREAHIAESPLNEDFRELARLCEVELTKPGKKAKGEAAKKAGGGI
jgi:hypothetical protein